MPTELEQLKVGDYVLGTKYADGDPRDGWAVGYVVAFSPNHSYESVVIGDGRGNVIGRANGFRRAKRIKGECGEWMARNASKFENLPCSMWHYFRCSKKEQDFIDLLPPLETELKAKCARLETDMRKVIGLLQQVQAERDQLQLANEKLEADCAGYREALLQAQKQYRTWYAKNVPDLTSLQTPYDKALAQTSGASLLAKMERMRDAIQSVIDSCVHPNISIRAVMVDLKPLREALKDETD